MDAPAPIARRLLPAIAWLLALTLAPLVPTARGDVIDLRIASSTDDAEESSSRSVNLTSSDLELTLDGSQQVVGMRWTAVAIPQGATILSAYVQFTVKEAQSDVTNLLIQGQAADHAATFTTTTGNVSSRVRTGAGVGWNPAPWASTAIGTVQRTPDLADVIREIVGRPGWASGNALALIVTGTGHRTVTSYNGSPTASALLHVEFQTEPLPDLPPVADLAVQTSPLTVTANAGGSTDPNGGSITGYTFDFGDLTPVETTVPPTAAVTHAYAAAGRYTVTVTVTDNTGNQSSASVEVEVSERILASLERRVAASADDAEESSSRSVSTSGSDLELVLDSSIQTVGMRFRTIDIPPGATVTNAYLQFVAKEAHSGLTNLVIRGQAADNAAAFTTSTGNVSSRARTVQGVSWVPAAWAIDQASGNQRTPNLAPVIQEIVGRSGWTSGNALVLVVTGDGRRTTWSFDGRSASAPLLHIDYSIGPPPPDDPPLAELSLVQVPSPPLTVVADASASTDTDHTPIASYRFEFDDGTVVTTAPPVTTATHTFSDKGVHTVVLIVTDTAGNASAPLDGVILVNPPPDDPPVARLTVTQVGTAPLTVRADASASTDTDHTPIGSYEFDFGDTSGTVTLVPPEAAAIHTYGIAGPRTITVRAIDTAGQPSAPAVAWIDVVSGYRGIADRRVASSQDDAEESSSRSVSLSSSDLELVMDSSIQTVGMRWTGLAIPRGAVITSAYLQFTSKEARSEATNLVIQGQAADNAATFTTSTGNVSSRARTTRSVTWVPAAWAIGQATATQRSPDLREIIQEIVDRPGWIRGNALALIVTGGGRRTSYSFDGSAASAAQLVVEYLSSEPPQVDEPPVARLTVLPAASPAMTVTADASTSTDTDATPIQTYRFDFGDNTPAVTTTHPVSTATHTYAAPGNYVVTLTATDTGGLISAPVTANTTVTSTSTSSIAVYAGYFDTHHSSRLRPKPNPWRNSPNVTFVGTQDPGTSDGWDSSAIRIDNLGATDLSVVVNVDMGSKKFALWGTRTVPAGKTLILAQTGFENFDGSDTSPAGCYGCSPSLCLTAVSSFKPTVTVTVAGKATTYLDATQVLNTGGADMAGCPATGTRNDESTNWVRIFPAGSASAMEAANAATGAAAQMGLFLAPLFPNPTQGQLDIEFRLPTRSEMRMTVYDVMGRRVKTLMDETLEAGPYRGKLTLDELATGMYFLRLWTPAETRHREFFLVR